MPITIQPAALKYKLNGGTYQSVDCLKGDQGDDYTLTSADKSEIAGLIDFSDYVETITGTTVYITGVANHRYMCGEVSTISITPPSVGTIDVVFTSGSTATVLTLPDTVKMPEWWSSPKTNHIYELMIVDGIYGSIMSWAT